jgi:hypothetical protein
MTYLAAANAHLVKAREFLEAARDEYDFDRLNACLSSAVISGVNSKDAICLKTTKHTNKAENHNDAIVELKHSGPEGPGGDDVWPASRDETQVAAPDRIGVRTQRG